jgi:DNA-binding CsgD family transcriptional regulator
VGDTTSPGTRFKSLSAREREVLGLAAAGLMDKQIGPQLDVSLNTLRTYWSRIREKAGDEPRTALVAAYVAEELGKHQPEPTPNPLEHEGWVLDPVTRTLLATDGINSLHGLPLGVAHPVERYRDATHPEDVERVWKETMSVASGEKDIVHLVFRIVTPFGVEVANSTVRAIRDASGRVTKVYGFRTKTLDCRPGRNPSVLVGHWEEEDYESEFFTVDEAMARILGAPSAGRISRSSMMTWKRHPEDEEAARRACEEAVAARKEHLVTDVRLVLGDGKVVWGRAKRRFEYQSDGRVRIFGTFSVFE